MNQVVFPAPGLLDTESAPLGFCQQAILLHLPSDRFGQNDVPRAMQRPFISPTWYKHMHSTPFIRYRRERNRILRDARVARNDCGTVANVERHI